jgi:hypothetical protein
MTSETVTFLGDRVVVVRVNGNVTLRTVFTVETYRRLRRDLCLNRN